METAAYVCLRRPRETAGGRHRGSEGGEEPGPGPGEGAGEPGQVEGGEDQDQDQVGMSTIIQVLQ